MLTVKAMLGVQFLALVPILVLAIACQGGAPAAPGASPLPTKVSSIVASAGPSPSPSVIHTAQPAVKCHYQGNLPDPSCTPGAINPDVTQSTLRSTICMTGWTATVRPTTGYTEPLKAQQMREYGDVTPDGILLRLRDFEEDHRVPLEVGGHPSDPHNLWPEPIGPAHMKDHLENYIKDEVCSGVMSLAEGQAVFLGDYEAWQQAHPASQ